MSQKILKFRVNSQNLKTSFDKDSKDDKESLINLVQKLTAKTKKKKTKVNKRLKLDKINPDSSADAEIIKDILMKTIDRSSVENISPKLDEFFVNSESISDMLSRRILEEKNKAKKYKPVSSDLVADDQSKIKFLIMKP